MQFLRSFFRRITDDLKIKKLIPLKILFFVHASTLLVLYPYLTIHMRELGINVEEAAIMSAVTPVVSIVMPPLAGMLADKIGNFKLLLALSSVMGGVSALLLLLVPVGRLTLTFPSETELLLSCSHGRLGLRAVQDHACKPLHPYSVDVNLTVQACGLVCENDFNTTAEINALTHYTVQLRSPDHTQSAVYHYTTPESRLAADGPYTSTSRVLKNDVRYASSVRIVPDIGVFFPASDVYSLTCDTESAAVSCDLNKMVDLTDVGAATRIPDTYRVLLSHDVSSQGNDVRAYSVRALHSLGNSSVDGEQELRCTDGSTQEAPPAAVSVHAGGVALERCRTACVSTTPRTALCENTFRLVELDPSFTFWSYLAVRVFIGIISGTAFAMFEGAVIAILREQNADYGLQRIYGSIGGMISSPLSGLLIDYASRGKDYTDFRPAFYLYAALKVLSGSLMLIIDLQFKQPTKNIVNHVLSVFCNVEIAALFIACFVMGTAWGFIEHFLFWLLQDLGASKSLMGITITVGGIAGLPLLVMSGPIIRRLGHANVLFIGFIFYAIRLLGYSLIYNPWLCLVFEALESVTSSLSFTAAVTYAARLSSSTTDTSVQGLLGGIYYGVGKGAGSLTGGFLIKYVGTRTTYQLFSAFTLLSGCLYFLFNKFYLRKRPQVETNDIYKKKPKNIEKPETVDIKRDVESNDEKCADIKLTTDRNNDSTDGSSDSGVDNPGYVDGEAPTEPPRVGVEQDKK